MCRRPLGGSSIGRSIPHRLNRNRRTKTEHLATILPTNSVVAQADLQWTGVAELPKENSTLQNRPLRADMAAPAFRVRRIQPLAAAMPPATRHVPAWQPLTAPHRVNGISVNQRMRSLDLPRDAGAVYRKRAGIVSRHHDDTMTRDENRAKKCKKYLILLNKFAGVVQWQNGSFPIFLTPVKNQSCRSTA